MSSARPFPGLRPPADKVQRVACPPYDVVSTAEARRFAEGNPLCFFHVSRPEIDLPGVDEHAPEVYERGAANLAAFTRAGWLTRDPTPCFYLYRQRTAAHSQTGLVATASVEEYQRGLIKKHELTRVDKEDDRTRHIDRLDANDEPVFLTYRARPSIDALVARHAARAPVYDFTVDGVTHTFWVIDAAGDVAALERELAAVPVLYIADGHHRSAAAARVFEARKQRGERPGRADAFLAVLYPDDQLQILPYNRLVKDLNGLTSAAFLARVAERFTVGPAAGPQPTRLHDVAMYLGGRWQLLSAKGGSFDAADPVASLDVSILQANLLAPILGIADPRTNARIDFVGGARGTAELERRVDSGEMAVAFSMFPTRVDQLIAIADAGAIMPPKSTWFEPKPRSGLVLHEFH